MYFNHKPLAILCPLTSTNLVQKWAHSITFDSSFLTEWGAVGQARHLAFSLGTYDGMHFDSAHCSHCKRVRFSGAVDFWTGWEDESTFLSATVPHETLVSASLNGAPLSILESLLPQPVHTDVERYQGQHTCISGVEHDDKAQGFFFDQCRIADQWHSPLPPEVHRAAGAADDQELDPDVIPDHTTAPTFVQDLFQMADRHGVFTDLDGDGVLRVRTWYVHHLQLPRQTISRTWSSMRTGGDGNQIFLEPGETFDAE